MIFRYLTMSTSSVSTPSNISTSSVPTSTNSTNSSGVWEAAQNFFKNAKKKSFTFLSTSSQRVKPAKSCDADSFYMYGCGSINMP
ncbi:unnamed protein product [Caenorhabditis angaria]|uniref:Uncharacterized protein n=1 Tax=Caenorhabditis angaria TaxID=860376 RepID=A0A9P1ILD0_9PELO|nr:unnamed protein product [Caenorhabditis angaria]